MTDHTTIKLVGFIHGLKIYVRGIPYITTFIMLQKNVIDVSYCMLLGRPWLKDAKVTYDWGNNIMTLLEF